MTHPIHQFFAKPDSIDLPALRAYLDGLDHNARVEAVHHLGGKEQARLFEAAQGFKPLTLDDFVPPGTAPLTEVIHYGRNTLPAFNNFQKRFARPENKSDELWGYNEGSTRWLVGPGYFVTRQSNPQEVVIDYYHVPSGKVATWPEIKPNESGLSRLVYAKMHDFMRGVSEQVTIGRANKKGKDMDAWFVLCRDR
jgi:hypothetical protein